MICGARKSAQPNLKRLLYYTGDLVLDGSSTLTLPAASLQHLTKLFEQYLLSRSQQHGFLALPSHPADTASLLQLQFLFDILQKTVSLKLINPPEVRLQSVVKIFPFKSLKCLELKRIPPHCLEGLRGVYSQLEVFTCLKSLGSLEELLSLCGGDLSSALPWLELHTLNFSYNFIVCLDQSLSLLNILKSLDLSHNKIQECAEFLKPLSELEHLNLGYNCLQRAPTLGMSARAKLLTLILRNNELETINGVEQLSSLQHLDLAYNLLLEHSQLAPLSLLHCLKTLSLEGNPLFFQKTHRTCTVRHLSPKAAILRLKLDGCQLSSHELSVSFSIQSALPIPMPPERSNLEVSSGAGELSDSLSVGEVGISHIRKKKYRSRVRVRRASISEPSDTDYETRQVPSTQSIVLPHQEEIERMSSFREQLGEDWLRYQHHLDGASSSAITIVANTNQSIPQHKALHNGLSTTAPCPSTRHGKHPSPTSLQVLEALPPPLFSSEPRLEISETDGDQETESTLERLGQSTHYTESTLEDSTVDGQVVSQEITSSPRPSLDSQGSAKTENRDIKEEEEEDLGGRVFHLCCLKSFNICYRLIFLPEDIWTPLTVLATRETLYLLREDHQWTKSSNSPTEDGNKEACDSGSFAVLETLPISCVSSVQLWPSHQCRIDLKLYDEVEKTWCVWSESTELLQGLLSWVTTQWEAMFGVKLHTTQQEKEAE
uniref:Uncharacterized protein n=1 Tax=Echeneis naucrates TaxID=173247 RepID=A0A665WJU4_ECHNA